MQYFQALKLGQKRVADAREYLNKLTDGKAMPALALTDNKSKISTFSLIDKLSINLIFLINHEYYYKTPLHHHQKNHSTEFFYQ